MVRAEMLARMTSQELTAWMALLTVQDEEAELARLRASSNDGQVIITGRDDDEDDEDDGPAE